MVYIAMIANNINEYNFFKLNGTNLRSKVLKINRRDLNRIEPVATLAPGRPADKYLGQVDRIHRLLNQGPNLTYKKYQD